MKKLLPVCFLILALILLPLLAAEADTVDLNDRGQIRTNQITALTEELSAYPADTVIEMANVKIDLKDAVSLCTALPELHFHFTLTTNNISVDSDTADLDLDSLTGTKKRLGVVTLARLFTCMPNLTHVTMFNQRPSTKDMESILDQFPDVDFEWTITLNNYLIRTDVTAFSTLKGRQDPRYTAEMLDVLKYCKNLVALDVGHNNVSDLSFVTQWPHMKLLICIDSKTPVTDLSPLADMDELEYVELFMQGITDISALANKPNLLDLNLCHNDITDLTPLYSDTKLERLWISYNPHLTEEEVAAFKEHLPNCQVETVEYQSTGAGWREHDRYFVIKDVFKSRVYRPFDSDSSAGAE